MDSRVTSVLAITGVTILSGALAYALYFDYKRRNDTEFRKKLRKEKKRVDKTIAQSRESLSSEKANGQPSTVEEAVEMIRKEEPFLTSNEEREKYFTTQIAMGEQLSSRGAEYHLAAAMCFYRSLRMYPAPMELMVIYEQTVAQPIFTLVIQMMNADVKHRAEGYYKSFPPKSMKTRIQTRDGRKVLIVTEDIAAGELVYKEKPVVTALDADLQGSGKYCAHCLRSIQPDTSVQLPKDANPIKSTFCSKACLTANRAQSHNLLFTVEPPLPPPIGPPVTAEDRAARHKAQESYLAFINKEKRAAPVLIGRFIARQIENETSKMTGVGAVESEYTVAEVPGYMLADHLERLRYLELKPPAEERKVLVDVLKTALPGLEQFVTEESHATLLGKITYNVFGVCFDSGRDDKPESTSRPEDIEKTRTPYGTSRQIGTALYTLSSYLAHSCTPNTQPSFSAGTSELHLIANRDLKEGDELTVAYVDVNQREGETTVECRRRRRIELARGWRFACPCQRCAEEGKELSSEEKVIDATLEKDGSKVDASVSRYDDEMENNNVE